MMNQFGYRRILTASLATLSGLGGFSFYFLPNTYFREKYKEIIHFYRNGIPIPITQDALDLKEQITSDMKLSNEKIKSLSMFVVYGFDYFNIGNLSSGGACVGIPPHFYSKSVEDLKELQMNINHSSILWSSPEGKNLADALFLSENAKKFAIAREIAFINSNQLFVKGTTLGSFAALSSSFLSYFHTTARFKVYSRKQKVTVYAITVTFSLLLFLFINDHITCYYEKYADLAATTLGKTYIEGGIEFYKKLLKRNIALRTLLDNGEKLFTKFGNEVSFLRDKHIPNTQKLLNIQALKEDIKD